MKQVIVTADDFGLCPEVNRAVIEAHEKGILTCASLMIGAPAAKEAVRMARRHPSLKIGLHIVLADGVSILPRTEIPGLVNDGRQFSDRITASGVRYFFSRELRRQIARECDAQIRAFFDAGLEMDHVNSHNHLHVHPAICDILLPLVHRYDIPAVRLPRQVSAPASLKQVAASAVLYPWVFRLRRRLEKAGVFFNCEIFGLLETGRMTEAAWLRTIPRIHDGVTEIYCHPAVRRSAILRKRMPSYRNTEEFSALLSPRIRQALDCRNVIRTGFAAARARSCAASAARRPAPKAAAN